MKVLMFSSVKYSFPNHWRCTEASKVANNHRFSMLSAISIQLQLPSPLPSCMPGSPFRDVPCRLPTLDPSSLQIREVGAFENADMADRFSRKVRRLPIIITFSLMRCLLPLSKVISCPSKCIIWPQPDAILMDLKENTNLEEGAGGMLLCFG